MVRDSAPKTDASGSARPAVQGFGKVARPAPRGLDLQMAFHRTARPTLSLSSVRNGSPASSSRSRLRTR